jgi:hypothetical protein
MEPIVMRIFLSEVKHQCDNALIAYQDLDELLKKMLPKGDNMIRFWYSLQSFLTAVGNISKLFWPSLTNANKDKHAILRRRGRELRVKLSVGCKSPLKKRNFRNHLEHFDERLQMWAIESKHHNFVDSNIGPIEGCDKEDYLRNFDPDKRIFTFKGNEYSLIPVIEAVKTLHNKIIELQT